MNKQNGMALLGWAGLIRYSPPPSIRMVLPIQWPVLGLMLGPVLEQLPGPVLG
jgi:hypothetical protein